MTDRSMKTRLRGRKADDRSARKLTDGGGRDSDRRYGAIREKDHDLTTIVFILWLLSFNLKLLKRQIIHNYINFALHK